MNKAPLRVLHIEDSEDDSVLVRHALGRAGYAVQYERVTSLGALSKALDRGGFDVIIADYILPTFDAPAALRLIRERRIEIPFIVVSGAIGEETAVEVMRSGAHDYLMKDNLARLGPAIEQQLGNAETRREHRRAQESLRSSNDKLKAIVQASPLAIIALDRSGCVTEWNAASERIFGISRENALGQRDPISLISDETSDECRHLARRLRSGVSIKSQVIRRKRRDGSPIDLNVSAAPLHDEEGHFSGVVATLADVTERTRFLQVSAHELRNLLTSVKVIAQVLRLHSGLDDRENGLPSMLARLQRELDRLQTLQIDILEALRVREGLPLRLAVLDVKEVLLDIVNVFRATYTSYQFRFRDLAHDSVFIRGDAERLGQVFRNLIHNAVKYSTASSAIDVAIAVRGDYAAITVEDQGIGIPANQLERIFEGFYRATNLPQDDPGGFGLGLWICRDILDRHAGRIWAESAGHRTTFHVEVPLESEHPAALGAPPA